MIVGSAVGSAAGPFITAGITAGVGQSASRFANIVGNGIGGGYAGNAEIIGGEIRNAANRAGSLGGGGASEGGYGGSFEPPNTFGPLPTFGSNSGPPDSGALSPLEGQNPDGSWSRLPWSQIVYMPTGGHFDHPYVAGQKKY
jgi:hypothetical protein